MKHEFYEGYDREAPPQIKDRNGYVVLKCCKLCGLGEVELEDAPNCPGGRPAEILRPFCTTCGWRKGGKDSWDGRRCKCGHEA